MGEKPKREQIQLRHLALKGAPLGDCVVWWYGATCRNRSDKTLPHVVVWFRTLRPDGGLGLHFRCKVGITDLAILQLGTIWNEGFCRDQIPFEERIVSVDYSRTGWRYASQGGVASRGGPELIPSSVYPLFYGLRDRSEMLVFTLDSGHELLVPSLEFFSRCYGRSAEVNRVLSTYGWHEAEPRLYLPYSPPAPPSSWSITLANKIYNDDALFLAHVKYDDYARRAAKSIYSNLEAQFDKPEAKAFPQIGPWFVGRAKLIVQGVPLDQNRFLALRILGGSEPKGPEIISFRENPGKADQPAPEGAPESSWPGGRDRIPGDIAPLTNLTSHDQAGHEGDIVEVRNSVFRVVGARRAVVHKSLSDARTRPGPPAPNEKSDKHSPGERQVSGGATGVASIHTETRLETHGAARDVWEGLLYLREKFPDRIEKVGWYSSESSSVNFNDLEPCLAALQPFDEEQKKALQPAEWKWVYLDPEDTTRMRGVLIAFVKAPNRSAYLFEIERRRTGQRTAEDGTQYAKEQAFCGLIVSPPEELKPSDWIPRVLDGIRLEKGVMARVSRYCPGHLVDFYRRSASRGDEIAGHSTVVAALGKINIDLPRPRTESKPRKSVAGKGA